MRKYWPIILSVVVLLIVVLVLVFFNKSEEDVSEELADDKEVKVLVKDIEAHVAKEEWDLAGERSNALAIYYEDNQAYDEAIASFEDAGEYYTKAERPSFEAANIIRAEQIRTEMLLYVEQPLPADQELAKFEPTSGTYLGLYLAGKRENASPVEVEDIYGKNHAIYLTYAHWRKGYEATDSYFPMEFAAKAKAEGSAIQVAWEPSNGLDDVIDDEYVRQFAREAKETGIPIFLRFAGEMNGEWVPWHDTPEKYIEKFRLIHQIMKEEAPNVAMVWSPNFLPRHNIDPYYPGDDAVDWVGLSLYTIPFSHGREVLGGNPIDYLKPIYEAYSDKPIMISEGAVSHVSYEEDKDYSDWAASQIGNMYGFLPKMYPQVKAISYFNLDKKTTSYDNQNNNYDLGDSPATDASYQLMIQSPYFIDHLSVDSPNDSLDTEYVSAEELTEVEGTQNVFVYVKLPLGEQPDHVAIYQGDTKLGESEGQPWGMKIDFDEVDKEQALKLIAYDKDAKELATREVTITVK